MLFVQPFEELLKTIIRQNDFDGVERIAQFIMRPRFVDEILAGMTRGHHFGPSLAARNHMMSPRRHLPFAKNA